MSTRGGVEETLARLAPVTLEEVLASAALQTRVDRKYLVPLDVFAAVLEQVAGHFSVLEIGGRRLFRYESIYFDTPDRATYHQHAHDRPGRVKVRTRAYLDTGDCQLEFKRVGRRGETVKERYPYPLDDRHRLDRSARVLAGDWVGEAVSAALLEPVLTTTYLRTTLVDGDARMTCDLDLRFEDRRGCSYGPLDRLVVVESKTRGALSRLDRLLIAEGRRPVRLSKYCVGMAVLDPALPANRWNRELRTWFDWTPRRPWESAPPVCPAPPPRPRWARLHGGASATQPALPGGGVQQAEIAGGRLRTRLSAPHRPAGAP
ncbi:polyphosphate polymerase domain-containing protein [Nocardioides sp. HB32]